MNNYYELLKDPRWQKKRLEVLDRAGFECENCGANDKTLHVHHRIYKKGYKPWDYGPCFLACLCEECHNEQSDLKEKFKDGFGLMGFGDMEELYGYMCGLIMKNDEKMLVVIRSYEHAMGIGRVFPRRKTHVEAEQIIHFIVSNGVKAISGEQIEEMIKESKGEVV